MSRRRITEVECDGCGSASHYGNVRNEARADGWILSKLGDFCSTDCLAHARRGLSSEEEVDRLGGR